MVLFSVLAVCLVLVSPALLRLAQGGDQEWERLSFIGQTYGAMSAIIAVLALVGVAVTLYYQAREARRVADEGRRQAMGELLRMAMADPDLDECWGPVEHDADPKARKQLIYTNMIVTQWGTAFRAGSTPPDRLRRNATEMFQGAIGRDYWAKARRSRLSAPGSRSEQRFNRILDEAYRDAVAIAPAPDVSDPSTRPVPRTEPRRGPLLLAFGAGACWQPVPSWPPCAAGWHAAELRFCIRTIVSRGSNLPRSSGADVRTVALSSAASKAT